MSISTAQQTAWVVAEGEKAIFGDETAQDYRAMVETLRDYMGKTGFKKVLLGLSGGIDSAIVATIAADALGPENVRCVMLPSEYTSKRHSMTRKRWSPHSAATTTPCPSQDHAPPCPRPSRPSSQGWQTT